MLYTGRGQVIGEFVCDYIIADIRGEFAVEFEDEGCIPIEKQIKYSPKGILYGWRISHLKIYDKPMELSEFNRYCPDNVHSCATCRAGGYTGMRCTPITRPPQSWRYVEELL